jgi:putative transposase
MTLAEFIQSNPHALALKRALAVQMVQQDYSYREIQQVLHVSLGFISKWQRVYEALGVEGLELGYWGTQGYLSNEQKQELLAWLKTRPTWLLEEVIEQVEQRYGVVFASKQSYYDLLHQAGLSWKKSQSSNPKKDQQLVAQKNKTLWIYC